MEDEDKVAPQKESPIEKALNILSKNINLVQEGLPIFETILASVIGESEKPNPENETVIGGQTPLIGGQTPLEQRLRKMADDAATINKYLRELQNRIQL